MLLSRASLTTQNRTAWPSGRLTPTLIFRGFTFPPLSRAGTCHHSLTARHRGVITVARVTTHKQSSMVAQCCTGEQPQSSLLLQMFSLQLCLHLSFPII